MWEIKKIISNGEYNYCVVTPDHPKANIHGYILHHRVVMENNLGRVLESHEIVHHINENKKDNKVENLQVMTAVAHSKMHGLEQGRLLIELKCPECSQTFIRRKGQTYLQKGSKWTACSASCRGKFSRKLQLSGLTSNIETSISENFVREFRSFASY